MGSAKKMFKKFERGLKKYVVKPVGEVVEEVIEKPVKKIGKETFDVVFNTTDEERRAMLGGTPPPAPEPEVTSEVTPEVVPDDSTVIGRGKRRTKRTGGAGTIMEEYGVVTAKPIAKAVERA
jgi:hypothetical protein